MSNVVQYCSTSIILCCVLDIVVSGIVNITRTGSPASPKIKWYVNMHDVNTHNIHIPCAMHNKINTNRIKTIPTFNGVKGSKSDCKQCIDLNCVIWLEDSSNQCNSLCKKGASIVKPY